MNILRVVPAIFILNIVIAPVHAQTGSISISSYSAGGTSNDTTGVQAAFTACTSAGGCRMTCTPNITYTVDTISVGSNLELDGQGCKFKQRADGTNTFDLNGVTNVRLTNLSMVGTATPGGGNATAASVNTAVNVRGGSSNVWLTKSDIREFLYYPIQADSSSEVHVSGNYFFENAYGPRVTSSTRVYFDDNTLDRTALYSLTPTKTQFSVGFGLDSTDGGHSVSSVVRINNNTIKGFPYAQAVLVHAGTDVTVSNNIMTNVSVCVGITAYNTADILYRIAVVGNTCEGTSAASLPTSSDAGITVQAGPCGATACPPSGGNTPTPIDITVIGNVVHAFNRAVKDAGIGGIVVGYTNGTIVSGNVVEGCGGNGIVLVSDEDGSIISNNSVRYVVAVGMYPNTTQNGFLMQGSPRINLSTNAAEHLTDANGTGYRIVGSTTNMLRANNYTYDVTTPSVP